MTPRGKNHYAYRIEHVESKHYYVGIRVSHLEPELDPYYGSGLLVQRWVAKYGVSAFTRTVLARFSSREEANAYEESVVTLELLADPLCLNLITGGRSRIPCEETRARMSASHKGVKRGPRPSHVREKISRSHIGLKASDETRAKISAAHKGKKLSPEHVAAQTAGKVGKKQSPEAIKNRMASLKRTMDRKKAEAVANGTPPSGDDVS